LNAVAWEGFSLEELLPHASPMILLTRVVDFRGDALNAEVDITPDCQFARDAGVPMWVGIEYMAQAVAALAGIEARLDGRQAQVGFLLGTRKYQCAQPWFAFGTRLEVAVVRNFRDDATGFASFDCRLAVAGEPIAESKISVIQPPRTSPPQDQS